jgi:hypothetical protein
LGELAGDVMTAAKIIRLGLAVLLHCGYVLLLARSVLKAAFGERVLTLGTGVTRSGL